MHGKHGPGCRCASNSRANPPTASNRSHNQATADSSQDRQYPRQAHVATQVNMDQIVNMTEQVSCLTDSLAKVAGQYNVLQQEYTKMRRNIVAMTVTTRRAIDDSARQEERINQLSAARIYQLDIINDLKRKIGMLEEQVEDQTQVISKQGEKIARADVTVDALVGKQSDDLFTIRAQIAKLGTHELTIEELTKTTKQANDKIQSLQDELNECKSSMEDYRRKVESDIREPSTVELKIFRDARIQSIASAIETLKNNLMWGRFSGDSAELNELFTEVQQLCS